MKRSKFFLTHMTALGTIALLAQPVSAMTCAEFVAMDDDGQMKAVEGMRTEAMEMNEAGDAVREEEPLEDGAEGSDDTVAVEVDEATNADAPRGDEFTETITVIREECGNDPDFDMKTVNFEAPKEK